MKCVTNNKSGFTLIELILVIAILVIIVTIAVPRVFGFIETSRITADQSTVATLNRVTPLLRMNTLTEDPFENEVNNSQDLLEKLVSYGYLSSDAKPQSKSSEFEWIFEEEKWNLVLVGYFYEITLLDGVEFNPNYLSRLQGPYTGTSKDILIPSSMDGTDIRGIWQDTFSGKELRSVRFADDSKVEQIHARAFQNNQLTSIEFPDSLLRIDLWSFKNNNLTKIKLPPNLHTIEQNAFEGNNLTEITIGANVTTFGTNPLGNKTKDFIESYNNATTGGEGTYLLNGENWTRQ